MDGHQGNFVGRFFTRIVLIRKKRDFRKEIDEADLLRTFFTMELAELDDTFQQFLKVLILADALGRAVLCQKLEQAAFFDDQSSQFVGIERIPLGDERLHQGTEGRKFL